MLKKIEIGYDADNETSAEMIVGTKDEIRRLYKNMYSKWEHDKLEMSPACLGMPEFAENKRYYGILIGGCYKCHSWQETFSVINSDSIVHILCMAQGIDISDYGIAS